MTNAAQALVVPDDPAQLTERQVLQSIKDAGVVTTVDLLVEKLDSLYGPTSPTVKFVASLLALTVHQLERVPNDRSERQLKRGRVVWLVAEAWRHANGLTADEKAPVASPVAACPECGGSCVLVLLTDASATLRCTEKACGHEFKQPF